MQRELTLARVYDLQADLIIITITRFFINVQVQGQHPHLWATFQLAYTHGRSHTRSAGVSVVRVDSRELLLSAVSLCASRSFCASQAHAFHQPVCQRLSCQGMDMWNAPRVQSSFPVIGHVLLWFVLIFPGIELSNCKTSQLEWSKRNKFTVHTRYPETTNATDNHKGW